MTRALSLSDFALSQQSRNPLFANVTTRVGNKVVNPVRSKWAAMEPWQKIAATVGAVAAATLTGVLFCSLTFKPLPLPVLPVAPNANITVPESNKDFLDNIGPMPLIPLPVVLNTTIKMPEPNVNSWYRSANTLRAVANRTFSPKDSLDNIGPMPLIPLPVVLNTTIKMPEPNVNSWYRDADRLTAVATMTFSPDKGICPMPRTYKIAIADAKVEAEKRALGELILNVDSETRFWQSS